MDGEEPKAYAYSGPGKMGSRRLLDLLVGLYSLGGPMTTIAWDGHSLAADKQSTSYGMPRTVTKIHRIKGELFAMSGGGIHCQALIAWFKGERKASDWPKQPDDEDCGNIVQVTKNGIFIWSGSAGPTPEPLEDKFMAFGSGRDFAMAAMHLGKSAREAIEIASLYDINTGMGIDVLELHN